MGINGFNISGFTRTMNNIMLIIVSGSQVDVNLKVDLPTKKVVEEKEEERRYDFTILTPTGFSKVWAVHYLGGGTLFMKIPLI